MPFLYPAWRRLNPFRRGYWLMKKQLIALLFALVLLWALAAPVVRIWNRRISRSRGQGRPWQEWRASFVTTVWAAILLSISLRACPPNRPGYFRKKLMMDNLGVLPRGAMIGDHYEDRQCVRPTQRLVWVVRAPDLTNVARSACEDLVCTPT